MAAMQKSDQCSSAYQVASYAMFHAIGATHREMLTQLVARGPVDDGDVMSKSARDDLITLGLASRVCVKGEQGFTAANYMGYDVLRVGLK